MILHASVGQPGTIGVNRLAASRDGDFERLAIG
jgi:hypothetical protein